MTEFPQKNVNTLSHYKALIRPGKAIWSKFEVSILKIFPRHPPWGRLRVSLYMWKLNLYQKTVVIKSGCMKPWMGLVRIEISLIWMIIRNSNIEKKVIELTYSLMFLIDQYISFIVRENWFTETADAIWSKVDNLIRKCFPAATTVVAHETHRHF